MFIDEYEIAVYSRNIIRNVILCVVEQMQSRGVYCQNFNEGGSLIYSLTLPAA